jgi:mycothiol system anti-sigma-R factor
VSCGNPHETPCTEVLEDVYTYLDAECDQVSKAKIKQHLHECSPCLQEFGIEQEVKALVNRCCGDEVAPEGLRDRLKAKLREVVVTVDAQSVSVETTEVEIREI